jgi:hypothetical protein
MNAEAECADCRRLHDEASSAITRQLRAIARLDVARLRYEADSILSLEAVLREAKETREKAVAAYKEHRKSHAGTSTGSAFAQGGE